MFFDLDIKGDRLPPKTVCLTYDDGPGETGSPGPGPRTRSLARYLFEQGIGATFFVLGRHAEGQLGLLRQLQAWGHLVGNHTYSHPGLVALAAGGGDVVGEVARADELIQTAVHAPVTFFRAPYGNWREKIAPGADADRRTSIVASILNHSRRFPTYVGPINWDISSLDWEFWGRGDSAEQCAAACLSKIERLGRGIILMHDSSEDPSIRANNRSAEATQLLVEALKRQGYRFARLDELAQVQSAMQVSTLITLRLPDGHFLTRAQDDAIVLAAPHEDAALSEESLGVVYLAARQIALRASNGQFLSCRGEATVRASATGLSAAEVLTVEDCGAGQIGLRNSQGLYLARGANNQLLFTSAKARETSAFVLHRRA